MIRVIVMIILMTDLLGGEDGDVSTLLDLGVGLNLGGGGEGPATAAGLLVLDWGDGPLLPPVHGLGQLGGLLGGGGAHGAGGEPGHPLVAAHVAVLELLVSQVAELVHTWRDGNTFFW